MFCPCGSKKPYEICCFPYLSEKKDPPSPEALMRSRYTAYVEENFDYIEKTMKDKALSSFNRFFVKSSLEGINWIQLTILSATEERDRGTVEFIATFQKDGQNKRLHEISFFKKIEGKWYYIDGTVLPSS